MSAIAALAEPLAARWQRLPGNLRGGLWMVMGGLMMSIALAIAKWMAKDIHPFELNFFRCLFGLLALVPLLVRAGPAVIRTRCLRFHIGRGLFGGLGQICVYYALAYLPLAVVVSITFTRPLFLVVLAVLFLGERVRWRRWSAIAVGFIGVLIVARPVIEGVSVPLVVLVFSTLCHASAHTFLKKASGIDAPMTVVVYYLVISTVVGAVPTAFVWTTPTAVQFGLLAASGLFYLGGQGLITLAFRAAEATAVAPFDYSRLLYAVAMDIVVFSVFPDGWTIVGSLVIIGSTLYVARRQARFGRVRPAPDPELTS